MDADGTLNLHGRGSVCINTAGEKVYPEEVEEALKLHPAVRDAVVVGVPDEKWGEAVTALVELEAGRSANEAAAPRASCARGWPATRCRSAWCSRRASGRSPSGKVDYKGAKAQVKQALGLPA